MSDNTNELQTVNYFLGEIVGKSKSISSYLNNTKILERMECDEKEREELKATVELMLGIVDVIRSEGFFALDKHAVWFTNPVGKHIIDLLVNQNLNSIYSMTEAILPYLIAGNQKGKEFLESILIYEAIYDAVRGVEPIVIKYKLYGYIGVLPEQP